jgi:DNA-directed RNA polymerase subunit RPC12/RpoP
MATCATCGDTNRNECHCPQSCANCGQSVYLDSDCEWPEGKIRCWGCAHERIVKLEKQLKLAKTKQKR